MSGAAPLLPVAGVAGRERQRRIAFFFDDYLDPASRILEIAPAAESLEAYLKEAGFHRYTRLAASPPADVVGDVRDWRALGLAPASFEVVLAIDALDWNGDEAACRDLLAPGGMLFATAPIPGRASLARLLAALGMVPPRRQAEADLSRVAGFATLAVCRRAFVEQWARLRKPLDG